MLVGDDAQLPPVGIDYSPALDPAELLPYGDVDYNTMDEVVRQTADSGILFNATMIRCMLENRIHEIPRFDCSYPDFKSISGGELLETLQECYDKYGYDETIVITRSNKRANRYMTVLDPIKLVITNWEDGKVEEFQAPLNPADPDGPKRTVKFAKELYIERDDFMEEPPKKYFRLKPGGEVRMKYTYIIKCEEVVKDENGNIVEIRCTYDPTSKPGAGEWRSVKGTIHWVACSEAKEVEVRLVDRLFTEPFMDAIPEGTDYKDYLNPDSMNIITGYAEPALLEDNSGIAVQFERLGYFVKDQDSTAEKFVFNKTTGLKDTFKK